MVTRPDTNISKEPMSLESAILFQQEAITPYEKCLARHLIAALTELQETKGTLAQMEEDYL